MKSPEQFDFSKEKDQKKFEQMGKHGDVCEEGEKKEIISAMQEEGKKIKEKIDSGEAKTYEEAEKIVARETINGFIKQTDSIQRCDFAEFMENPKYNGGYGHNNFRIVDSAIRTLPFDESLKFTENLILTIKQSDIADINRTSYGGAINKNIFMQRFSDAFLKLQVSTEEELNKFISSQLENFVSPNEIVRQIIETNPDPSVIKKLIEKYGSKIRVSTLPLFNEEGIFRKFKKDEKNKFLEKIMEELEEEAKKAINEREEHDSILSARWKTSYFNGEEIKLGSRLRILKEAAENEIFSTNYEVHIKKLFEDVSSLCDPNAGNKPVISAMQSIEITDNIIKSKMGIKEKEIVGKGIEIIISKYGGGIKIYSNGEFVGIFNNIELSEKATNGEIVAWVKSETIDRDNVTGTQNCDSIYVWKKGWNEPKQIFEDHAWSSERYFRVFPPEVTPDGKIKIKRIDGKETIEEELDVK
ncbi:MAG: hypothetical protein ABIA02_01110 [Candidatus Falkowbacteria bacterium]